MPRGGACLGSAALLLAALAARRTVVHVAATAELLRAARGLAGLARRAGRFRGGALVAPVTTHDFSLRWVFPPDGRQACFIL